MESFDKEGLSILFASSDPKMVEAGEEFMRLIERPRPRYTLNQSRLQGTAFHVACARSADWRRRQR